MLQKLVFISAISSLLTGIEAQTKGDDTCDIRDYCTRHRQVLLNELDQHDPLADYRLDTYMVAANKIQASLSREKTSDLLASELVLDLMFYQDGIVRAVIGEPNSDRFRISQQGIAVEED